MSDLSSLSAAITSLEQGDVILYPTEAVYGLGCDPDNQQAVERLLDIKQRPVEKGLILIADNYGQLLKYVDDAKLPMDKRADIFQVGLVLLPGLCLQLKPRRSG